MTQDQEEGQENKGPNRKMLGTVEGIGSFRGVRWAYQMSYLRSFRGWGE